MTVWHKRCPKCGEVKTIEGFYIAHRTARLAHLNDGVLPRKQDVQPYCKPCFAVVARGYRVTHRHVTQARRHRQSWAMKLEFIEAYGGKCACCGEAEPKFLTLDHVNNDGQAHRKTVRGLGGVHIYRKLKLEGWPQEGYRILCFNCNVTRYIWKQCPHGMLP